MPDDTALLLPHMGLGRLHAEILVSARQLLHTSVKNHKIVHQLNQAILAAHPKQILVKLVPAVVLLVLFPTQEVLFRSADGAILKPLRVASGEDNLYRAEKPFVEHGRLIREALPKPVADTDAAVLQ